MNLYSEIYGSYYSIISSLLSRNQFSDSELSKVVSERGFGETMLYLVPRIANGDIALFEKDGDIYYSVLSDEESSENIPLSLLQKRWIKAILSDRRIRLFVDDSEMDFLENKLGNIEPLFETIDFLYVDRFTDGDDYQSEQYRQIFRTILKSLKNRQALDISFESRKEKRVHFNFIPCKLEYSVKNDKFRLYAVERRSERKDRLYTINLSRIDELKETGVYIDENDMPDLDALITSGYYKEPVTLLIKTERNALERAMLQFASYKKNTTRISDELYKCEIFYNEGNETELLIEVLSFGSAVEVLGNERFLKQYKNRICRQLELFRENKERE